MGTNSTEKGANNIITLDKDQQGQILMYWNDDKLKKVGYYLESNTSTEWLPLPEENAGGGKLYEHRISYIVFYNNASIFCRQQIINNYAEPYNSTTILDYLSIKSIGVCSSIEKDNNVIYTSPYLTNSSGTLRGIIKGLQISLAEDNTISIKGVDSQGSVSQFEDVVTEL